jgi:hypothetical protein
MKCNFDKLHIKLYLLAFIWTIAGLVFAFLWGFGWFFLFQTILRIVAYFPPLRQKLRKLILGPELEIETTAASPILIKASKIMGEIIIVGWIGLTIFVFWKVNVPLNAIIESLLSAN